MRNSGLRELKASPLSSRVRNVRTRPVFIAGVHTRLYGLESGKRSRNANCEGTKMGRGSRTPKNCHKPIGIRLSQSLIVTKHCSTDFAILNPYPCESPCSKIDRKWLSLIGCSDAAPLCIRPDGEVCDDSYGISRARSSRAPHSSPGTLRRKHRT
jgi:hypothetical protein